jgi:hypothetical protein
VQLAVRANSRRFVRQAATAATLLLVSATHALAQGTSDEGPGSKCWRFAFGQWSPPLDWDRAGHEGRADELAERVRRVRDSVFLKDTGAVRNNAMYWERTPRGWSVVLFPAFWPVGMKVEFDSVLSEGREMSGRATAFVADAGKEPSRARAGAVRCPG